MEGNIELWTICRNTGYFTIRLYLRMNAFINTSPRIEGSANHSQPQGL